MKNSPPAKERRRRLANDSDFLKKLVSLLEKEKLSREQIAEKLAIDDVKKITDSVLLGAVRLAGNSKILENIIEKTVVRTKKGPQYSEKKGLVIPAWQFEGKGIADGQKYEMTYGSKKGIITLRPINNGEVAKD
jgi:hypothetical protein